MLIAQFSDAHLRPRGMLLHGAVDSNAMLQTAIHHLNTLRPRPDLALFSGDLADEALQEEYTLARELLCSLEMPLLAIPGNHDEREAFRAAFADRVYLPKTGPLHFVSVDHGPVRIIGLDVTVPGSHHGLLDEDAAAWLEKALALESQRPTMIMMHQPPFATGIPYLDEYWCRDGQRLAEIVARYPAVERIACGHVHRLMQTRFGGTMLCTAPSVSTAIAIGLCEEAEPVSFLEPPGLLLHHWQPGRGLVTHLVPIGTFTGPLFFA
jgi:Icc protein